MDGSARCADRTSERDVPACGMNARCDSASNLLPGEVTSRRGAVK
jgi:hypothetical protein